MNTFQRNVAADLGGEIFVKRAILHCGHGTFNATVDFDQNIWKFGGVNTIECNSADLGGGI